MDDSCAVCAETLEWVAYGSCGHREVCSTCVSRLRFICEDRKCCICKTESDIIFVTKALGDYTKTIGDFSVFPSDAKEGKVGSYWYHEDTKAYFDDSDHYKMIKAMCRLSCSVCDNMEDQGQKRKAKFRNIEQLKGHLYHQHKLFMCTLCLEGRKIFICEHKLYTRAQLNQHINAGNSEVDGSESERGGFMGHPMCDFCKRPFYGENELYTHMSTEHFTCHICQRQHPGQYDYFKKYDDLEIHFRQQHFLCEDEACLAKKFIVFQSEAEMKRHNTLEHGGNMSRSKRNAALQIPTSFQYRRYEQENRRGRGRGARPDSSQSPLAMAIQASFETANLDNTSHVISSTTEATSAHVETSEVDDIVPPMESLATSDSEPSSKYLQAVSLSSRNGSLAVSSFPPLSGAPDSTQQNTQHDSPGLGKNTMAARIRRNGNGEVNAGQSWSTRGTSSIPNPGAPDSTQQNTQHDSPGLGKNTMAARIRRNGNGEVNAGQSWSTRGTSSIPGSVNQPRPVINYGGLSTSSSSSASSSQAKPSTSSAPGPYLKASTAYLRPELGHGHSSAISTHFPQNSASKSKVSHSSSAPNLTEIRGPLASSMNDFPPVTATRKDSSISNFPPITATKKDKLSSVKKSLEMEDVQTANKSLVERIRSALDFDENKYSAFREISGEFRQDVIGTGEYLSYVRQFGLTHLVLELASLCPDTQKQRELIETHNAIVRSDGAPDNIWGNRSSQSRESNSSSKGKGKHVEQANGSLQDNFLNTVRKLQGNQKSLEQEVEVLSKDGYRKGKPIVEENVGLISKQNPSGGGQSQNPGGGGSGKKKKTPKFQRVRLGDGSLEAALNPDSGNEEETVTDSNGNPLEGLPVRGVWRKSGGKKLVAMTQKQPMK